MRERDFGGRARIRFGARDPNISPKQKKTVLKIGRHDGTIVVGGGGQQSSQPYAISLGIELREREKASIDALDVR